MTMTIPSVIEEIKKLLHIQPDGSPSTPVFKDAIAVLEQHEMAARHTQTTVAEKDAEIVKLKAEVDRLKAAAGAVSAGPSFAQTKTDFVKPPARAAQPVDPAANESSGG